MLDGRYGQYSNRVWEFLARGLVRTGMSPNAVTMLGMVLVALCCLTYVWCHSSLIFALSLSLALCFDGLDGAVARLTGRSSLFGGYLDAVIDRYQELLVLAAIGYVRDLWPAALLVVSGGLITSYNKARVAMEIPISNLDWPDLLERLERMVLLIALLLLDAFLPVIPLTHLPLLGTGLLVLGALAHFTAIQRFLRARHRIRQAEANARTRG